MKLVVGRSDHSTTASGLRLSPRGTGLGRGGAYAGLTHLDQRCRFVAGKLAELSGVDVSVMEQCVQDSYVLAAMEKFVGVSLGASVPGSNGQTAYQLLTGKAPHVSEVRDDGRRSRGPQSARHGHHPAQTVLKGPPKRRMLFVLRRWEADEPEHAAPAKAVDTTASMMSAIDPEDRTSASILDTQDVSRHSDIAQVASSSMLGVAGTSQIDAGDISGIARVSVATTTLRDVQWQECYVGLAEMQPMLMQGIDGDSHLADESGLGGSPSERDENVSRPIDANGSLQAAQFSAAIPSQLPTRRLSAGGSGRIRTGRVSVKEGVAVFSGKFVPGTGRGPAFFRFDKDSDGGNDDKSNLPSGRAPHSDDLHSDDDVHVVSVRGLPLERDGTCVYFVRAKSGVISSRNMVSSIICGAIHVGALTSVDFVLSGVFWPLLRGVPDTTGLMQGVDGDTRGSGDVKGRSGTGGRGVASQNSFFSSLSRVSTVLKDALAFEKVDRLLEPPPKRRDILAVAGKEERPQKKDEVESGEDEETPEEQEAGSRCSSDRESTTDSESEVDDVVKEAYEDQVLLWTQRLDALLSEESHYSVLHTSARKLADIQKKKRGARVRNDSNTASEDSRSNYSGHTSDVESPEETIVVSKVDRVMELDDDDEKMGAASGKRRENLRRILEEAADDTEGDKELSKLDETLHLLAGGPKAPIRIGSVLTESTKIVEQTANGDEEDERRDRRGGGGVGDSMDGSALVSLVLDGWFVQDTDASLQSHNAGLAYGGGHGAMGMHDGAGIDRDPSQDSDIIGKLSVAMMVASRSTHSGNRSSKGSGSARGGGEPRSVSEHSFSDLVVRSPSLRAELVNIVGPRAEYDYWRKRVSALNAVESQLSATSILGVIAYLTKANSPIISYWNAMVTRLHDAAGEAADNVKFLGSLKSSLDVLGHGSLTEIAGLFPNLFSNIQMMRILAHYYSTTERMTMLLVSLSSAVAVACRCEIVRVASGVQVDYDVGNAAGNHTPRVGKFLRAIKNGNVGVGMLYEISKLRSGEDAGQYRLFPSQKLMAVVKDATEKKNEDRPGMEEGSTTESIEASDAASSAFLGVADTWPAVLWNHERRGQLLVCLYHILDVYDSYVAAYEEAENRVLLDARKIVFELDRRQTFGAIARVCKRIEAVIQVLEASNELILLRNVRVDDISSQVAAFESALREFHEGCCVSGPCDPFDLSSITFEDAHRQFVLALDQLYDTQIEFMRRTVHKPALRPSQSLDLLDMFRGTFHRPLVTRALDDLYWDIFRDFERLVDAIQVKFEEDRHDPPRPRFSPRVAGCLAWAHHLLGVVSVPFSIFEKNGAFEDDQHVDTLAKFAALRDDLQHYCDDLATAWKDRLEPVRAALSSPILLEVAPTVRGNVASRVLDSTGGGLADTSSVSVIGSAKSANEGYGALHVASQSAVRASAQKLDNTIIRVRRTRKGLLREYRINFDFRIEEIVREAAWMMRFGVGNIPDIARSVLIRKSQFFLFRDMLADLVKMRESMIRKMRPLVRPLILPLIQNVDLVMEPGLWSLSWMSINLQAYLTSCSRVLDQLATLITGVMDMLENRILQNVRHIENTILLDLPFERTFSTNEFVLSQEHHVSKTLDVAVGRASEAFRGVIDLLNLVRAERSRLRASAVSAVGAGGKTVDELSSANSRTSISVSGPRPSSAGFVAVEGEQEVYESVRSFVHNAFVSMTVKSLEYLKDRGKHSGTGSALFEVEVMLQMPRVVTSPRLDELQECLNCVARCVVGSAREVPKWPDFGAVGRSRVIKRVDQSIEVVSPRHDSPGHRRVTPLAQRGATLMAIQLDTDMTVEEEMETVDAVVNGTPTSIAQSLFSFIASRKRVFCITLLLSGFMQRVRSSLDAELNKFRRYSHLWLDNRKRPRVFLSREAIHVLGTGTADAHGSNSARGERERLASEDQMGAARIIVNRGPLVAETTTGFSKYDRFVPVEKSLLDVYRCEIEAYLEVERTVAAMEDEKFLHLLCLVMSSIKSALKAEASGFREAFCHKFHDVASERLRTLSQRVHDLLGRMELPLNNLDSLSSVVKTLQAVRDLEASEEFTLQPVVAIFEDVQRYKVSVSSEEIASLRALRASWDKMSRLADELGDRLVVSQCAVQRELERSIKAFETDVPGVCASYRREGAT